MTDRPIPALSICLPVGTSGVPLAFALRTIGALAAQTSRNFEVVVGLDIPPGVDASDPVTMLHEAGATLVVPVERTAKHPTLAHRNHARNAAWRASRAPLCLMLDADFILPPHAVQAIIAEQARLLAAGTPAVMSPALCQFGGVSTEQWLAVSWTWAKEDDPAARADAFCNALRNWHDIDRGTFSGFGDLTGHPYDGPRAGLSASVSVGARMLEGMPILPRKFLEAVGGFDESYIGWGGDKISLVDVLRGLCAEGVIELRALVGVVAMHQPHPTDPHHTSEMARANEHRRQMARMQIDSRSLTWKRRIPALAAALHDGWRAFAMVSGAESRIDDPADDPPAEVIAGIVAAVKSPRMTGRGNALVVVGPGIVARACSGQTPAVCTRAALGEPLMVPGAALVLVSPLPVVQYDGVAEMNAALDDVHARAMRMCPGGPIVVAQRIGELPPGGRARPGYLRPMDMQDRLMATSATAQIVRAGGQNWALVRGRL